MKRFVLFLLLGMMSLLTSCITEETASVYEEVPTYEIIIRNGRPYYYNGAVIYYAYNGYRYYPSYRHHYYSRHRHTTPPPRNTHRRPPRRR